MFDERFFDSYLVELMENDFGYQTAEVFLNEEGQGLVRQAFLFRIDEHILRSHYERRGETSDREQVRRDLEELEVSCDRVAQDVWRFRPRVHTQNSIINTYPPNVKSLSGSSANHIELTTVQDFDRVSPLEYSFPHRSAYESEYRKYLMGGQLKSLIAIPIFVRGIRGILRVMNKIDWRTVPYGFVTEFSEEVPGYDLDRIRDVAAKLSRDLTYNDNAVFHIRVPQINLSEDEAPTFESILREWWGAGRRRGRAGAARAGRGGALRPALELHGQRREVPQRRKRAPDRLQLVRAHAYPVLPALVAGGRRERGLGGP
ncbi:MAG: hypothetical protein ACE5GH_07945, partial [Fidelibacterota bacterium]